MNLGNLPVEATLATLLIMSVLTWVIGISKYLQQRRLARDAQAFLADFWQCKDLFSAAKIAKDSPSDMALLAQAGAAKQLLPNCYFVLWTFRMAKY